MGRVLDRKAINTGCPLNGGIRIREPIRGDFRIRPMARLYNRGGGDSAGTEKPRVAAEEPRERLMWRMKKTRRTRSRSNMVWQRAAGKNGEGRFPSTLKKSMSGQRSNGVYVFCWRDATDGKVFFLSLRRLMRRRLFAPLTEVSNKNWVASNFHPRDTPN